MRMIDLSIQGRSVDILSFFPLGNIEKEDHHNNDINIQSSNSSTLSEKLYSKNLFNELNKMFEQVKNEVKKILSTCTYLLYIIVFYKIIRRILILDTT